MPKNVNERNQVELQKFTIEKFSIENNMSEFCIPIRVLMSSFKQPDYSLIAFIGSIHLKMPKERLVPFGGSKYKIFQFKAKCLNFFPLKYFQDIMAFLSRLS